MSSLELKGLNGIYNGLLKPTKGYSIESNRIILDNQLIFNDWNIGYIHFFKHPIEVALENKIFLRNYLNTEDRYIKISFSNQLDLTKINLNGNKLVIEINGSESPIFLVSNRTNQYTQYSNIKLEFKLTDKATKKVEKFLIGIHNWQQSQLQSQIPN